jgi:hypothetical protein
VSRLDFSRAANFVVSGASEARDIQIHQNLNAPMSSVINREDGGETSEAVWKHGVPNMIALKFAESNAPQDLGN